MRTSTFSKSDIGDQIADRKLVIADTLHKATAATDLLGRFGMGAEALASLPGNTPKENKFLQDLSQHAYSIGMAGAADVKPTQEPHRTVEASVRKTPSRGPGLNAG